MIWYVLLCFAMLCYVLPDLIGDASVCITALRYGV